MLNHLIDYARKTGIDSEPGFTARTIRWLVEVSEDGKLCNILPLGDDKKGEQVSKCPEMHNMNAGGRSHFLIETLQTVALLFKLNETQKKIQGAKEKQSYFIEMVQQSAAEVDALKPLAHFLTDKDQIDILRGRLTQEKAKPTDWLCWRINGLDPLEQTAVLDWWRAWRGSDQTKEENNIKSNKKKKGADSKGNADSGEMICFLTGKTTKPLLTQPNVTGLSGVGGLGTGAVMAGFDKAAFCSFGLKQASNSAMNEKPAYQYIDALNHLIKNYSRKLANVLVVHWFKDSIKPEDDPLAFLYEPPELTEKTAQYSARQILESIRTGQHPATVNNRYYALTLSGVSARVMVRDWMEGNFEELVSKIEQWFADFEIVARDGGKTASEPKFLAVCGALVRDLKELPAPTATTLWRVALAGLPIPQPFLVQALVRFRSDLIGDKPFNHARMGLIKAYFIRKGGNHNMSAHLNKEHPESAYQCGRLLAVLAALQRSALGDVGAGVVQRYYVAASQTPGLTIGRLVANAKNHLNKLEGGLSYWYEGQIAEILSRIEDRIPATLSLEKQGLFALGYYQQIAANRQGKNSDNKETKGEN